MPHTPLGPCCVRGCPGRAVRRGRCAIHAAEAEARWREAHPDQRPSAARRGYGSEWREIRAKVLRRQPLCVQCAARGLEEKATDVDHIIPLRAGGTNDMGNLRPLCHSCHSRKTAEHDGAWGNRKRTAAV